MSNFEINIKDNFFKKNLFEKIKNNLNNLKWEALGNFLNENSYKKHPWFTSPLEDDEIKNAIKENVSKYFRKKIISFNLINYSMVTKIKEPLPHNDFKENQNYQILIYLKGTPKLTNGTGFYVKENDNQYILNTHVGFFENRAIFFKTNVFHSPLTWDENSSARFSIICFLKTED